MLNLGVPDTTGFFDEIQVYYQCFSDVTKTIITKTIIVNNKSDLIKSDLPSKNGMFIEFINPKTTVRIPNSSIMSFEENND